MFSLDDDQQSTLQLYDYLLHVDQPIKESTGHERLQQVLNKTAKILEFFEFLGDGYRNGTLGDWRKNETTDMWEIYITINQSRFNGELWRFLTQDKEENTADGFAEKVFPRWNPGVSKYEGHDWWNFVLLQMYLSLTFNSTLDAYNYLRTDFARALLETSSNGVNPLRHCENFLGVYDNKYYNNSWKNDNDGYDTILRAKLCYCDAPDCEYNTINTICTHTWGIGLQCESEKFAKEHGLNGGNSNRCFAKFIIRYHNYSAEAYERFVHYVAKYLYQDTILHGLCTGSRIPSFENATATRMRRKEWVKERVAIIGSGIFEARSVLDETPPTAAPSELTNSSDVTHTVNQTWLSNVKAAVESAIGEEEIPYPTPGDAFQLYKGIYSQIVGQLRQVEPRTEHGSDTIDGSGEHSFNILVYYPAYGSTEQCVKSASEHVLHGRVKNVNYVVSLRKHLNSNATLETRKKLEEYFKKSEKADQCDRISEINGKMQTQLLGDDGLSAIVSIKCARKFVWYELAHQYFQAAYTEAPKVQTDPGSKYSAKCGMLVMFP